MKICWKRTDPQAMYFQLLTTRSSEMNGCRQNENAPSSEKVQPMLSSHIKIHQHICLGLFLLVNGV